MHHYEITSIVIINLLTLNTLMVQSVDNVAKCPISTTPEGLVLANCSGNYIVDPTIRLIIPQDLSRDIQVLDLSQYGGKEAAVLDVQTINPFENYRKLKRIILRRYERQYYPYRPYDDEKISAKHALQIKFKELDALECLEFTSSKLDNNYPITLPKNLKTLIISNNSYTYLSVEWCGELVELDANQNKLNSVPKFHIPDPPLTTLRMKGSPLTEMTILDIAPLCELTLLELEFPPGSHYLTEAGYCKCVTLKNWVKQLEIKGVENVKCAASKTNCSENIVQEAKGLRKKCPLLKLNNIITKKAFSVLKYVFFSVLFLLLLATLILYIIRHFHLREYWRAHHAAMAAQSINMEKGEESLKSQESSLGDPFN